MAPEFTQRGKLGPYSSHDRWAEFSTLSCNVEARTFLRIGEVKVFFGTGKGTSMTLGLTADEALVLSRELVLAAQSLTAKPEIDSLPEITDFGALDAATRVAA